MGKHVKKKNEAPRFSRRREEPAERYTDDAWLDAPEGTADEALPLDDPRLFDDDFSLDDLALEELSLTEELPGSGALPDDRVEQVLVEPEEEISVPEAEELPAEEAAEPVIPETAEPAIPETEELSGEDFLRQGAEEDSFSEAVTPPAEKPAPARPAGVDPIFAEMFSSRKESPAPAAKPRKKKPRPEAARAAASARKKKRRRAKKFKKGLKVYAIVMLCLIAVIGTVLWVLLARYQRGVDARSEAERLAAEQAAAEKAEAEAVRRAPQQAFEAWEAGTDSEYWTDLWFATHPMELESRDMVQAFMEQSFSAAVPYKAAEYTDESPVYVLRNGDATLSRIYLNGSGTSWNVSQVDLLLTGDKSASVNAITGSRIFCNGVELGPEYVTDSAVSFSYGPLSDRLVNPVSMLTYTVEGLLAEPVLTAEPPEGCNLVQTEDGGFLLCMSQAEGQPLADKAVSFVRAYLYYFMSGYSNTYGNLYYALSFLTQGTQAYSDLQDTLNGVIWNTAYANIDTTNTTASDVVIWSDNCRSVDVSYSAKCTLNGAPIDYADATMRIYFLQANNGTFYISNFENL